MSDVAAVKRYPTCTYFYGRTEAASAVCLLGCNTESISFSTEQMRQRVWDVGGYVVWGRRWAQYRLPLQNVGGPCHWTPCEGQNVCFTADVASQISRWTQCWNHTDKNRSVKELSNVFRLPVFSLCALRLVLTCSQLYCWAWLTPAALVHCYHPDSIGFPTVQVSEVAQAWVVWSTSMIVSILCSSCCYVHFCPSHWSPRDGAVFTGRRYWDVAGSTKSWKEDEKCLTLLLWTEKQKERKKS